MLVMPPATTALDWRLPTLHLDIWKCVTNIFSVKASVEMRFILLSTKEMAEIWLELKAPDSMTSMSQLMMLTSAITEVKVLLGILFI